VVEELFGQRTLRMSEASMRTTSTTTGSEEGRVMRGEGQDGDSGTVDEGSHVSVDPNGKG